MDIMEFINTFLAICGGISIIGGAIVMIWKFVNPAVKLGKRVEVLEAKADKDYAAIEDIKTGQGLLCQGMIAMIDAQLSGNNIDNLKRTKGDIIKYLTEGRQVHNE